MSDNGILKNAKEAKSKYIEIENNVLEMWKNELNHIIGEKEENNKKGNAKQIKENAIITYGKEVSNYVVKDAKNSEIQADKDVKWQIFYADDENIYLIANSYVKNTALPYAREKNADGTISVTDKLPNKVVVEDSQCPYGAEYKANFVQVVNSYSGMDRILSNNIYGNSLKSMNKKYFEMFPDGIVPNAKKKYSNNKVVAYMQDIEAWKIYTDNKGYANYAIGGPTLEMLYESYIQTHPKVKDKLKYTVTGENTDVNSEGATGSGYAGYLLSIDGGTTWQKWTDSFSTDTNRLYVADDPQHQKAYAYWVSSPSAVQNENIMAVYYYGRVRHHYYDGKTVAFRPVVCLSSKVVLELNEKTGKYEIIEY